MNEKPVKKSSDKIAGSRKYIAIDLKSFYASVECMERGLDPLKTNLVVADAARTEKTICLAVSPALKTLGIPGRPRLFEVVERVAQVNARRKARLHGQTFSEMSVDIDEINADPNVGVDYITAVPRMAEYMKVSSQIYKVYLRYIAPEDIHVYSIDEVFIDATDYLDTYEMSARDLCIKLIREVLKETGITATGGIGTNLYLCKIAMDIVAKHMNADSDGVRIAELDEMSYRKYLWTHRPITDFWRIGPGYARKLEKNGMFTMGDVARCSIDNEDLLFDLFGVNAELLIDHAWGYESTMIKDIKAYRPENESLSHGQVLPEPYRADMARLIVMEMTDHLILEMVEKGMCCDQMVLTVVYDISSLDDPAVRKRYKGNITKDRYGRKGPESAHGSVNLGSYTTSSKIIMDAIVKLYDRIVDEDLLVRRIYVVCNHLINTEDIPESPVYEQMDLFTDYDARNRKENDEKAFLDKERKAQEAVLEIRKKFGKNAMLKGMNLEKGATAIDRNKQVGGHRA